jgi:GNAT superfamily N-acetyltransferase
MPCLKTAQSILAIEAVSLQDSRYTPDKVVDILAAEGHRAYMAYEGSHAVGFCSCFITFWADGAQLEVDMLGVVPEHRGRSVAKAMVGQALADAQAKDIGRARAIVEVSNSASQGVFRHLGFVPDAGWRAGCSDRPVGVQMLVYDLVDTPPPDDEALSKGWRIEQHTQDHGAELWRLCDERGRRLAEAETQQVQTLSYAGLWLEALWADTPAALRAMTHMILREAARRGLDEVGCLAAHEAAANGEIALEHNELWSNWIRVGWYQIWKKRLDTTA